jgi:CHAT domain-containing protein/tetratricopeptide (TPR) repeat protein
MNTPSNAESQQADRIASGLVQLLGSGSLPEAARVLHDNPELRSDAALSLLTALKSRVGGVAEQGVPERIVFYERLIRRSFDIGTDAAVEEAASSVPRSRASLLLEEAAAYVTTIADSERLDDLVARLIDAADERRNEPREMRAALLREAARLSLAARRGDRNGARDKGIGLYREAAEVSPPDSQIRTSCFAQLAYALVDKYRSTHEGGTLDEAVSAFDEALSSSLQPDWEGAIFGDYGAALLERYLRNGRVEDLDRAIEVVITSVRSSEHGTLEFAARLVNLAAILTYRYRRSGLLSDLDTAIDATEAALKIDLPAEIEGTARTNYGNTLRERYVVSGNEDDLRNAMTAYQRALAVTTADNLNYPNRLSNLAALYTELFLLTHNRKDLDQAIIMSQEAVEKTPIDSPELITCLGNRALALKLRYEFLGETADRSSAVSAYRRAITLGREHHFPAAVLIAGQWGRWASLQGLWREAGDAYSDAFSIFDELFSRTHSWRDRESYLSASRGLPENGAYALMRSKRMRDAVVILEKNRTRLLDEALARYAPELTALSGTGKDHLVEDFRAAVRRNLMGELMPSLPHSIGSEAPTVAASVEAIRAVRGFRHFLKPVDYKRIAAVADRQGPLVYLAAAQSGGLAMVIRDSHTNPEGLWLSKLTEDQLGKHVAEFMSAYDRRSSDPAAWRSVNDATLNWLWDVVMGPVMAALPESRAVLLPMGLLTMLPLNAAWTPDTSGVDGRRYVLDSHVITYACSARSLPSQRSQIRGPDERFVVISPSQRARVGDTLPGADVPHDSAVHWFGDVRELRGQAVSRSAVFAALGSHDIAHFACPMRTDLVDSLVTCVVLGTQDRLTVRSLVTAPSSNTRIAVVPAGESALPGAQLPNELISIPTGFHAAGVCGVLACLWEINNLGATTLMNKFYSFWRDHQMNPPDALRAAQTWMRNAHNNELKSVIPVDSIGRPPFESSDDDDRPFASPIHWAGFVYSGI